MAAIAPGFNLAPPGTSSPGQPFQFLDPSTLAQIARGNFRPPGLPSTPGMPVPQPQQPFGIAQGLQAAQGFMNMGKTPAATPSTPATPAAVTPGAAPVQPGQMASTSAIDQALGMNVPVSPADVATQQQNPMLFDLDPLTGGLMPRRGLLGGGV